MKPCFVIPTDASAAALGAAEYTSQLAAHVQGHLVLLPIYKAHPELGTQPRPTRVLNQQSLVGQLQQQAEHLMVPVTTDLSVGPLQDALLKSVQTYHPWLLAFGGGASTGEVSHLLPQLQALHVPLLQVPEQWPETRLPLRIIVAVASRPFHLSPAAVLLAPLLQYPARSITAVHIATDREPSLAHTGLLAARRAGVFGPLPSDSLYEVREKTPVEGILQAAAELHADLVVLLARVPRWFGTLFRHNVVAQVLQRSQVPVLVLPTQN